MTSPNQFPEIDGLLASIVNEDAVAKKEFIKEIKAKIASWIASKNISELEDYFFELSSKLTGYDHLLGIVKNEFAEFTTLHLSEKPESAGKWLSIQRILELPWGNNIPTKNIHLAQASYELAVKYSKGIVKIATLKQARALYRKLEDKDKQREIQQLLNTEVEAYTKYFENLDQSHPGPPELENLMKSVDNEITVWINQPFGRKLHYLFDFPLLIKPLNKQPETRGDSLVDLLESVGAVVPIAMSSIDSRIGSILPPSSVRINYDIYIHNLMASLHKFSDPLQVWLKSVETHSKTGAKVVVWQMVIDTLAEHLEWESDLYKILVDGVNAFERKEYQYCMSLLVPNFEGAMRHFLALRGENILQEKERKGLEDFILFDGLMKKMEKYFPIETVLYWRYLFSTNDGLGLNFRNLISHGIFPYNGFNKLNSLAVFFGYLFLINLSEDDETQEDDKEKDAP